ncbi:MAG: HAMP domain-containing histidine kinase [Chromatiaceae bacterium]|nr:HAMP domain-containing histidine kinase [Chromatiaceae bacterium]
MHSAMPSPTARSPGRYPTWGALRWLFLVRLLMVVGLTLVFSPGLRDPMMLRADTPFAWNVLLAHAVAVLASGLSLYGHWPSRLNQVYLAVFVDTLAFSLLMHAAGGIASGLGLLLVVAVAAGALTMEGRLSLLFAALASLAVIAEQTHATLRGEPPAFTQAGLLGMLFFATAIASQLLYRRIRTAEALAERRQIDLDDLANLNNFIIQNIGMGILVADGERRPRLMNQAARELLGLRRAPRDIPLARFAPALAAWLDEHARPRMPSEGTLECNGRALRVTLKRVGQGRANGVILYLRDDREVQAEAQQIKLAALGTLTASIAHNIRNPLSAISHAAQLAAEAPQLRDEELHLIDIIRRNSARIEDTVESVLQISRRERIQREPLALTDWLADFCHELRERHRLPPERLQLRDAASGCLVETDPRHLRQILANLCENALIHAGPAPCLDIRLGLEDRSRPFIEVMDDGPGIAEDIRAEIFNPFFTTSASGSGLGLYIARTLAEANGITLDTYPRHPHGSCFRLLFPSLPAA